MMEKEQTKVSFSNFVKIGAGNVCLFLFHHHHLNFCQNWRRKPLFVPFPSSSSSSKLLSKLEKETFVNAKQRPSKGQAKAKQRPSKGQAKAKQKLSSALLGSACLY